ncbi:MAG: SDR family NAD(P)-dependent oxidoreductase [Ilumatobacteraceae bacterium]
MSGGRLAGKRAVVTGAARGIGAAIAETFERHGATVARLDVTEDDGIIGADLADPDAATAAATRAIDQLGGIDILVNNAGVLRMAPLLEITVEQWDSTFDVNVRAMLLTMQMAARSMIASGRPGTVINMASMGGKVGSPNQAHYAASKAAVIALTRVAAMELGPHHITVNCICPGYVLTEMGAATRTQAMIDAWSATSPLGRLAQPADVANMALFLASEEASYCTGQAMNVTGGMIFH